MPAAIAIFFFLGAAHAAYDSCNKPVAKWAGLNQAQGNGGLYAAAYLNGNVYIAGYQAGDFAFHSSGLTGSTGDHGDDHTAVQTVHATGSHTDPDEDGVTTLHPSEQNGWDAVVTQISVAGVYGGIFAVDTMPVDGKYDDTSLNSGWGGYSYFTDLDSFTASGDKDHMVVAGSFRGKLTFPVASGADAVTLSNPKWQKYDSFLTKYNVKTQKVVWATGEKLQTPTCNTNTDGTPDKECSEPTSVGGSAATTAQGHVIATSNHGASGRSTDSGRLFLFNGNTGANVWEKQLGKASLTFGTETIGNVGYVVGFIKGTDVDPFETGTTATSCGEGTKNSAVITSFDASATGSGTTNWAKTVGCGVAASIVADPNGKHVYVGGHLDKAEEDSPYTIGDCKLTGKYGGFLMKMDATNGDCVWATDTPQVGYYSTRWGFRYHGLTTDGTFIWTLKSDDTPMQFDSTRTVPNRGSSDDGFLAKYSCADGVGVWADSIGGSGDDNLIDVVSTPNGTLVAGTTKSASISLGATTIKNLQHARSWAESDTPGLNAGHNSHFAMMIHNEEQISCIASCPSGKTGDAVLKPNNCLVEGSCVADGEMYEYAPCKRCESAKSTTTLQGPITTNHCWINNICVPKGRNKPAYSFYNQNSVCEACQPDVDTEDYSLVAGHYHDRDFAAAEGARGSRGCYIINQISKYGTVFEMQSNGCQMLPDMNVAGVKVDTSGMSHSQMAIAAINEVNGATKENKGADKAWLYYHGDIATCTKATVEYTQEGTTKTHGNLCAGTPAHKADVMAEAFETILYYGQSMARVKVQQGLVILKAELNNAAEAGKIADLKKDIISHIMISAYQGVVYNSHYMTASSDKASYQAEGLKYWEIIHPQWDDGEDKVDLSNMFAKANAPTGDFHYCSASMMLMRNMPSSSAWHYGAADDSCYTNHGGGRSTSRPSLDHSPTLVDPNHVDDLAKSLGKTHQDPHEVNPYRLYLSEADMGKLKVALVNGEAPTCSMPPPPPLPVSGTGKYLTSITMGSSASINDFTDAAKATIITNVATAAKVPEEDVKLTIATGPVKMNIVITTATPAAASAVQEALAPSVSSVTAAGALMPAGISVTSVPTMKTTAEQNPSSGGLTNEETIGVAVAASVGGLVLLILIYIIIKGRSDKSKPIFTCLDKEVADKKEPPKTSTGGQPAQQSAA